MRFPIAHFENKRNFFVAFNGGRLIITDNEYIIKWLFVKIIKFPKEKTEITPISDYLIGPKIYFRCGKRFWELQFTQQIAEKLFKFLKL